MAFCICDGLHFNTKSISIYYELQSRIRVKRYGCPNLRGLSISTFEGDDILRDSIRHPSKKLLSFEFAKASTFNFERLDILRDSIRHPSKKLLSFELAHRFNIQFRVSRYIMGLNQTSE